MIEQTVTMHMLNPVSGIVIGVLKYDINHPLEVKLTFDIHHGDIPIEWVFARNLLSRGLVVESGIGDVQVMPVETTTGTIVMLEFTGRDAMNRESSMTLIIPWVVVENFLIKTFIEVPLDCEYSLVGDLVDTAIQQILDV